MTKPVDYQTLQQELDEIVHMLQQDDTKLDEAIKLYERGSVVAKQLEAYLAQMENTVTKLTVSNEG